MQTSTTTHGKMTCMISFPSQSTAKPQTLTPSRSTCEMATPHKKKKIRSLYFEFCAYLT